MSKQWITMCSTGQYEVLHKIQKKWKRKVEEIFSDYIQLRWRQKFKQQNQDKANKEHLIYVQV